MVPADYWTKTEPELPSAGAIARGLAAGTWRTHPVDVDDWLRTTASVEHEANGFFSYFSHLAIQAIHEALRDAGAPYPIGTWRRGRLVPWSKEDVLARTPEQIQDAQVRMYAGYMQSTRFLNGIAFKPLITRADGLRTILVSRGVPRWKASKDPRLDLFLRALGSKACVVTLLVNGSMTGVTTSWGVLQSIENRARFDAPTMDKALLGPIAGRSLSPIVTFAGLSAGYSPETSQESNFRLTAKVMPGPAMTGQAFLSSLLISPNWLSLNARRDRYRLAGNVREWPIYRGAGKKVIFEDFDVVMEDLRAADDKGAPESKCPALNPVDESDPFVLAAYKHSVTLATIYWENDRTIEPADTNQIAITLL